MVLNQKYLNRLLLVIIPNQTYKKKQTFVRLLLRLLKKLPFVYHFYKAGSEAQLNVVHPVGSNNCPQYYDKHHLEY